MDESSEKAKTQVSFSLPQLYSQTYIETLKSKQTRLNGRMLPRPKEIRYHLNESRTDSISNNGVAATYFNIY